MKKMAGESEGGRGGGSCEASVPWLLTRLHKLRQALCSCETEYEIAQDNAFSCDPKPSHHGPLAGKSTE